MARRSRRSAQHWLFALAHPYYWPRWSRRLVLLGAPVAVPLWIALLGVSVALVVAEDLFQSLAGFWNGTPRYSRNHGYRGTRIRLEPSPDPVEPLLRRSSPAARATGYDQRAARWRDEDAPEVPEGRVAFIARRQRVAGE